MFASHTEFTSQSLQMGTSWSRENIPPKQPINVQPEKDAIAKLFADYQEQWDRAKKEQQADIQALPKLKQPLNRESLQQEKRKIQENYEATKHKSTCFCQKCDLSINEERSSSSILSNNRRWSVDQPPDEDIFKFEM